MASLTPEAFAKRWADSTLTERSAYQQHFLDLCDVLGAPKPAEKDPKGEFYTFEKGVEKTGGGKGFADVWFEGHFAIEYKGKHKDLGAAYGQLLQYRESLQNPPILVVTDTDRFEVHTNFTGTVTEVHAFTNEELPDPENLRVLRAMFEDPYSLKPERTVESVTEEAAGKFARLADGMRDRGVEPEAAAHFLNKLLFCLFAEDVRLLPEGLFSKVVARGARRPDTFNANVGALFAAMSEGGEFNLEDVLRFNGGLFADAEVVPLEADELRVLAEAARLDWGAVEPAIFGTLFERSLDPSQRSRLGAHYTSKEDILAVVEPVLMAPLRREWDGVRDQANTEATRARGQSDRAARNTLGRVERELTAFAQKLRAVRVLDPACGSGNFLYVSLKQLLDLEKGVSRFAGEIGLTGFFPEVSPEQLHGIETSPYAHELAQVAIWIGYLQWTRDNGYGHPAEPILGKMQNILHMDAILGHDEDGNPVEPEWPEADVIVGNPPFLGGSRVRGELGDQYVLDLWRLYEGRVPGGADLVCYWFERARHQIEDSMTNRVGLLATNSIRGGSNRRVLERIKRTGDIFFAESDRLWILNGAAVRVSMVGFDGGIETLRTLDGAPAVAITSALTGDFDLSVSRPLLANRDICFRSDEKGGPFDIDTAAAQKMLAAPTNPNGRPNSDVVRPYVNGLDVTRRPRNVWIIDFGVDTPEHEAALYEVPFEYVRQVVKQFRDTVRNARERERWWLHRRPAPDMRTAVAPLTRFIGTPRVAKHRLFVWFEAGAIPDTQIYVFARNDDYFFGMLHSRAHELWSLRMGTWMGVGNDLRYTPTTCFETFPFPEPTEADRASISEAARRLDELRRNWLDPQGASEADLKKRTLTNLYNARPTWLDNAHKKLDAAVFAAYGWPADVSDEDILKNLLALNLERSTHG